MSFYKEKMAVIELDTSFDPWLQASELLPMSQVCPVIQTELASSHTDGSYPLVRGRVRPIRF